MGSLTKKWHGLPVWTWAAIASVVLFSIYYLYKKRASGSASSASAPADAGTADDGSGSGFNSGDGGGSGTLSSDPTTTPNEVVAANNPTPAVVTSTTPTPTGLTPQIVGQVHTPVSPSSLVPIGATATSLQSTVAKANAKDIFPKTTADNHPAAVKVAANKTGASANKTQGVFSIH